MKNEDLYNEEPTHGDVNEPTKAEYLFCLHKKLHELEIQARKELGEGAYITWGRDEHTPTLKAYNKLAYDIARIERGGRNDSQGVTVITDKSDPFYGY